MIGYVTIGTNDIEKSKAFWCALLEQLGASVVMDAGRIAFIGNGSEKAMLAVCTPYDENAPHPGNGAMVAIDPGSKEMVDTLYARALELGATGDGEPGQRIPDMFYGAYFKDPDGNKACFYQFA